MRTQSYKPQVNHSSKISFQGSSHQPSRPSVPHGARPCSVAWPKRSCASSSASAALPRRRKAPRRLLRALSTPRGQWSFWLRVTQVSMSAINILTACWHEMVSGWGWNGGMWSLGQRTMTPWIHMVSLLWDATAMEYIGIKPGYWPCAD